MFPSNSFRRSYVSLLCLGLALLVAETRASFEDYGIPLSDATVDVKVFNVGTASLVNTTHAFLHPVLPGRQSITFPLFAFLVEHTTSQKRIMFDLGMRKDPMNFAPSISGLFSAGIAQVPPHKDITELLEEGGVPLNTIDAVVWSHSHFDHIGDMSKFPNTTALVVGPGTDHQLYPEFPNGALQASDFAGHNLTELNFNATHLTFGSLKAIDYFGDGSFYLLNTPGHLAGHISALARVTPTSFIMLAGDAFHHAGQLRPRPHFQHEYPCPAELLEETKSSISTDYFWSWGTHDNNFDIRSRYQPLYEPSDLPDSFYVDPATSAVTIEKIATLDPDPDFFILATHDLSLVSDLPYFPASLNNWKKTNIKERTVWNFVNVSNPAFSFSATNGTA